MYWIHSFSHPDDLRGMTCHSSTLKPCLDCISSKSCKHTLFLPPLLASTRTHTHAQLRLRRCEVFHTLGERVNIAVCGNTVVLSVTATLNIFIKCTSTRSRVNAFSHLYSNRPVTVKKKKKNSQQRVAYKLCAKMSLHNLYYISTPQTWTPWAKHNTLLCWICTESKVQSPVDLQVKSWKQDK